MRRHIVSVLAATACASGLAFAGASVAAQGVTATAQSTVAGVTVKVTPRKVAAGAQAWVFAIVLDTHSQDLSDDLLQTTTLVGDDGRELKPSAWKGAAAGGHHRAGTLEFAVPEPAPRSFELRMRRPGEREPRVFRFGR
ncbi:MAG TPA: hypothetical protein VGD76_11565 [Ramlibacter sp.]